MPMGLHNAPATQQCRVTLALREFIGKICHVYLDDIIIWLRSLEEHQQNVAKILNALKTACLYCLFKKSNLFCTEMDFLGHHILEHSIEVDVSKVEKILNWPHPYKAKHVRQFLGLVHYIAIFLPALAKYTSVFMPLTKKEFNADVMTPSI